MKCVKVYCKNDNFTASNQSSPEDTMPLTAGNDELFIACRTNLIASSLALFLLNTPNSWCCKLVMSIDFLRIMTSCSRSRVSWSRNIRVISSVTKRKKLWWTAQRSTIHWTFSCKKAVVDSLLSCFSFRETWNVQVGLESSRNPIIRAFWFSYSLFGRKLHKSV